MFAILSLRSIEKKYTVYRGKECMKKLCEYLRTTAMKIISFEKKKMKLLTKDEQKLYKNAKKCSVCQENLKKIFER